MPTLNLPLQRNPYFRDGDGVSTMCKRTDEVQVVLIDWTDRLDAGETIAAATFTVDGVTLSASSNTVTTTSATITETDGELEVEVTTSAGRRLSEIVRFVSPDERTTDYA